VTKMIDVHPGTVNAPITLRRRATNPYRIDNPETTKPSARASRNGALEKLTMPSIPNFIIFPSGNFVSPAKRSSRS
jgi:hypothetical protein